MIYFDNNATTQVIAEAREAMLTYLDRAYGNPSAGYTFAFDAKRAIGVARENVADLLGAARPEEIVFTSGGTESDNWAILGALESKPGKNHIITTSVEHEAIRNLCLKLERRGVRVTWLEVDSNGALDIETLRKALCKDTAVVSAMLANNETGILFPIGEIARIVKDHSDALFHVDGVNAVGKVPIDLKETEVDLFSVSGHKFHAPKGIGALYVRDSLKFAPVLIGGGQERGRRAGTEAVHQIAAIGAAAVYAKDLSPMKKIAGMRDRLEHGTLDAVSQARLNGTADPALRLPNTSSISFENINGEMIMDRLDAHGICVSTGSACNSRDHTASAVLQAMNVPYSYSMGAIRFSLGRSNTDTEIDTLLDVLPGIISEQSRISG